MKGILQRLLGRHSSGPATREDNPPPSAAAGGLYLFRTRPYTDCSPGPTGRYAAIKLIGVGDNYVGLAVLDAVWSGIPTLAEVLATSILNERRFAYTGRPAVYGVLRQCWTLEAELDEFRFVALQPVTREEARLFDAIEHHLPGSRTAGLFVANHAAEGEWRWANDREALVEEVRQRDERNAAERAAREERYRTRLKNLTWAQLRSEIPFARWSPSPPFPPEDFAEAARAEIRSACDALEKLGPRPRRADVRAILKKTVIWFNEADEQAGGVIETEEREDIYAVLEEMAHVAQQKVLVDEIDQWREW